MKILLLDDESFTRRMVTHQLEQLGLSDVVGFEQPLDALAFLEAEGASVDIVLLDLQMPGMDGIEVLRHLARQKFGGGVILLSGEDRRIVGTALTLARAHNLNMLGALHKPVTPPELHALLSTVAPVGRPLRRTGKTYTPDRVRQAIIDGELVNYYQPKVDFTTGITAGVETLVRWQHPEDGLVFPDAFIGIAEAHGFIDDLTRAVLLVAIRQAHAWNAEGHVLHVGVNVSMDNLSSLDFPDFVASAAVSDGVPLRSLILEVTESRLMTNALAALEILTRLRLKHIGLSIDDFGTGHSSLAQLRDIPFDELKVDKGFVHGAGKNLSNRAILEASLGMARQLGMRTVAEGVEDRDDWDTLRAMHCDLAQGYFIAKPMPASAIPAWLIDWEPRRIALVRG